MVAQFGVVKTASKSRQGNLESHASFRLFTQHQTLVIPILSFKEKQSLNRVFVKVPKTERLILSHSVASFVFLHWHEFENTARIRVVGDCQLERLESLSESAH